MYVGGVVDGVCRGWRVYVGGVEGCGCESEGLEWAISNFNCTNEILQLACPRVT